MKQEVYEHRLILLSDPHFMCDESRKEYRVIHPESDPSLAVGDTFGYKQSEKMEILIEDVRRFAKENPPEAMLILGDLGTDDYDCRHLPENYAQRFRDEIMSRFPCKSYVLPGNHDSYPNEMWKEMFGYDRQYSLKIGDTAFIMLDTYRSGLAKDASGGKYTGVDIEWLDEELKKYPEEKIYLCSHFFWLPEEHRPFQKYLKDKKQVVGLFMGHTHRNDSCFREDMGGKVVTDLGGYAYQGEKILHGYTFNNFYKEYAWGFGVLEWNKEKAHYYHIKYPRTYRADNGVFDYEGAIEDEWFVSYENGNKRSERM